MKKVLLVLGVLLFLLAIIVLPQYLKDLRAAQKRLASYQTTVLQTSSASVEYLQTGSGEPILISHGITGGIDQGLGLADCYIGGTYNLIAVSRFGYMKSPLPEDSSPKAQAMVYKELLDSLHIDKVFVFGNSAGGTSAFQFALMYPERCKGLILVSSNVPTKVKVKLPPKPVMGTVFGFDFVYWSFAKLMGDNMLSVTGIPKSVVKTLTADEKNALLNGVIMGGLPISRRTKGVLNDLFLSNPDINNSYSFEDIKMPVLMIGAKDDTMIDYQNALALSKRITGLQLFGVESGGHILIGHEKEIQQKIAAFIQSNRG